MPLHIYATPPIDWFAALMPVDLYYARLRSEEDANDGHVAAARAYVEGCVRLIEEHSYYGGPRDYSIGPFVTALPDAIASPEGSLLVMIKGENNGTFYVASPMPLSWLDDHKQAEVEIPDRSGATPQDW